MGQDVKVIAYADKAVLRLQKKFRSMIARELACFVWEMETGNID